MYGRACGLGVVVGELDESALPEEYRRKPEESKKKRNAPGGNSSTGSAGAAASGDGSSGVSTAGGAAKKERDWGDLLDWRLGQSKDLTRLKTNTFLSVVSMVCSFSY